MFHWSVSDSCPRCGERGLPPLTPGSPATARACQGCGYVQELDPATGQPTLTEIERELLMESYATIEFTKAPAKLEPLLSLDCVYATCTLSEDRAGPIYGHLPSSVAMVLDRLTRTCACGAGAHVEAPGTRGVAKCQP